MNFLAEFEKRNTLKVLQKLLPYPESSYEDELYFDALINYVDATVFGTINDALQASSTLQTYIPSTVLKEDESIRILASQEEQVPDFLATWKGWQKFTKKSSAALTWHSFRYPMDAKPIYLQEGDVPLIVLEPVEFDFGPFLKSYEEKLALFLFETPQTLCQMLQYPEVVGSLNEPNHIVYVMQDHPNPEISRCRGLSFQPILFAKRPILERALKPIMDAIQQQDLNWLYHICKNTLFCLNEARLGKKRAAALVEKRASTNWFDSYKVAAPKDKDLGPEPKDYFGARCKELKIARTKRSPKAKIKLAHIVPQIVEGTGHAPTRLLTNLLTQATDRFELFVVSTERLVFHPNEYPYIWTCSRSSLERGSGFIHSCPHVQIANPMMTYEETARAVADYLKSQEIDVACFHGPDVINTLCTQMADVTLTVLFEHGTLPDYPGFDAIITSSFDTKKLSVPTFALPYAIDVRSTWEKEAPTKEALGLPYNCFAMTTISHHLDNRLSDDMCLAICEILKQCPNAVYAPIGPIIDKERFLQFFKKQGVQERVHFLGQQQNPSQCARAMDLYLNEFPFGSGLAILEAMASGCPVVSMYDPEGPAQARYGANYYGIDRVIISGKIEDYAALAVSLIKDCSKYSEWQQEALKRYEEHTDIKAYTARFEEIILQLL